MHTFAPHKVKHAPTLPRFVQTTKRFLPLIRVNAKLVIDALLTYLIWSDFTLRKLKNRG